MSAHDNYPVGYREHQPSHLPMPEEPTMDDKRMELYDEYSLPNESFEDCMDRLAENIGEDFVYKLSRRTR